MTVISLTNFRNEFSDILNRVGFGGERICIKKNGKPIAAIVTVEDLEALEALENHLDLEDACKALKETGSIRLEDLKKRLGM